MLGLEREAEIINERKRANKEKILRNPKAPHVNNGLLTDVGTGKSDYLFMYREKNRNEQKWKKCVGFNFTLFL